ncbi:MAG TPA: type II secretion system protein N [Allosphingosinicella sp.]|jgi:general secretion pathway protein N
MRLRLRWWRELFFLGALLFALVALLPLRFAVDSLGFAERGLTARSAAGSLWVGALDEAQLGPVPLGTVATRLRVLPLLAGRARLDVAQEGDGFRAGLTASRHGFGIDDASGTIEVAGFGAVPPATLDLSDVSARFADGQCAAAEGMVKVRLAGQLGAAPLVPGFSGEARCDGQAVLLPLRSQSGADRLDVRLFADGRYQLDASIRAGGSAYSQRFEGVFDSPR